MQLEIAKKDYNHVFTSPKMVFSKKFKKNILDKFLFTDCFYLFTIDKIHLVKKQNKVFQPVYTEIEKV